jgi:hypothetical protein
VYVYNYNDVVYVNTSTRMHLSNLVRSLFKCYHVGPTFFRLRKNMHPPYLVLLT